MWWQGLDPAVIHPRRHTEGDPVCPPPRKSPEARWCQVGPASAAVAIDVGARPAGAGAGGGRRGGHGRRGTGGGGAGGDGAKAARPSSAPALLRTPVQLPLGAARRDVRYGEFRQHIENKEVRRKVLALRRECHLTKDFVTGIDILSDPLLFDLKVLHNAVQRAKSASAAEAALAAAASAQRFAARAAPAATWSPTALAGGAMGHSLKASGLGRNSMGSSPMLPLASPSGGAGRARGASAKLGGKRGGQQGQQDHNSLQARRLRELCEFIDRDTKGHCNRMGLPHKFVGDPHLSRMATKMRMTLKEIRPQGGRPTEMQKDLRGLKTFFDATKLRRRGSFKPCASLDVAAKEEPEPETEDPEQLLPSLAEFLLSAGGSLQPTLEAMDGDGRGRLTDSDWEAGLELLGFQGDATHAWRQLDTEEKHELTLGELERRLRRHMQADPWDLPL